LGQRVSRIKSKPWSNVKHAPGCLVRATDDQLRHRPAYAGDSELVLARVELAGEEAIILNLDKLERRVLEHLDT